VRKTEIACVTIFLAGCLLCLIAFFTSVIVAWLGFVGILCSITLVCIASWQSSEKGGQTGHPRIVRTGTSNDRARSVDVFDNETRHRLAEDSVRYHTTTHTEVPNAAQENGEAAISPELTRISEDHLTAAVEQLPSPIALSAASRSAAPPSTQLDLADQRKALVKALKARIGDNLLEMALMEPQSVEYRRRARDVERDKQQLEEVERNRVDSLPSPTKSAPVSSGATSMGFALSTGDVVMHEKYLRGTVTAVDKFGIASIEFDQFGMKKLSTLPPFDRYLRNLSSSSAIVRQPQRTTPFPSQSLPPSQANVTHKPAVVTSDRRFSNSQRLYGNWEDGWALDLHSLSSTALGDGHFNTIRTEIGDLLYRLKYRSDMSAADAIAAAVADFVRWRWQHLQIAALIPIPPSDLSRSFQPVQLIARRVGQRTGIPVKEGHLIKTKMTPGLKNIDSPDERRRLLDGAFRVRDATLAGQHILLFDDLYRSGTTLQASTSALIEQGGLTRHGIHVLTVTKTRSKR
jgi:competence protein ComFC